MTRASVETESMERTGGVTDYKSTWRVLENSIKAEIDSFPSDGMEGVRNTTIFQNISVFLYNLKCRGIS